MKLKFHQTPAQFYKMTGSSCGVKTRDRSHVSESHIHHRYHHDGAPHLANEIFLPAKTSSYIQGEIVSYLL